jgi:hypothetical protein
MKPKKAEQMAARHFHARIDLNSLPASTVDKLNALALFAGRIRFESARRRDSMIIAVTNEGREIIWPTTADLVSFPKSQGIIAAGAEVYIPAPEYRSIRKEWDTAAALILKLAAADSKVLDHPLKEEARELLRLMWRAADQPCAANSADFMDIMRAILRARRDPTGAPPPAVFIAEDYTWTHVPTLRNWMSLSKFTNKLYPLADIRNGLILLGFEYMENLSRGAEGDSEQLCLWRGPLNTLEG